MQDTHFANATAVSSAPPVPIAVPLSNVLQGRRILVLSPDIVMAHAFQVLQDHGCKIRCVEPSSVTARQLDELQPDVIVANLAAPNLRSTEMLWRLQSCSQAAIMAVATADDEDACANALRAGADDYFSRPCRTKELVARVAALVRRVTGPCDDVVTAGDFMINLQTCDVMVCRSPDPPVARIRPASLPRTPLLDSPIASRVARGRLGTIGSTVPALRANVCRAPSNSNRAIPLTCASAAAGSTSPVTTRSAAGTGVKYCVMVCWVSALPNPPSWAKQRRPAHHTVLSFPELSLADT